MQDAGVKEQGWDGVEAPLLPDWQDHNSFKGFVSRNIVKRLPKAQKSLKLMYQDFLYSINVHFSYSQTLPRHIMHEMKTH